MPKQSHAPSRVEQMGIEYASPGTRIERSADPNAQALSASGRVGYSSSNELARRPNRSIPLRRMEMDSPEVVPALTLSRMATRSLRSFRSLSPSLSEPVRGGGGVISNPCLSRVGDSATTGGRTAAAGAAKPCLSRVDWVRGVGPVWYRAFCSNVRSMCGRRGRFRTSLRASLRGGLANPRI